MTQRGLFLPLTSGLWDGFAMKITRWMEFSVVIIVVAVPTSVDGYPHGCVGGWMGVRCTDRRTGGGWIDDG